MSVIYRFDSPGVGLSVRAYQSPTLGGTKALIDSVIADTLPTVDGKLEWDCAAADDTMFSWLATWDGSIEGPYSIAIPPEPNHMGDILISIMIPTLIGDVPTASRFVILDALRKTIRDFCVRTQMWKFKQHPIFPVEGQRDYELAEPSETEICSIVQVRQKTAPRAMDASYTLPQSAIRGNIGSIYGRPSRAAFSIFPVPSSNAVDPFLAVVSLQPTLTGEYIQRALYERWENTLLSGARSRLLTMFNKPWTDMNMGAYYRSIYETDLYDALAEMVKGGTNEVTTKDYPEFF